MSIPCVIPASAATLVRVTTQHRSHFFFGFLLPFFSIRARQSARSSLLGCERRGGAGGWEAIDERHVDAGDGTHAIGRKLLEEVSERPLHPPIVGAKYADHDGVSKQTILSRVDLAARGEALQASDDLEGLRSRGHLLETRDELLRTRAPRLAELPVQRDEQLDESPRVGINALSVLPLAVLRGGRRTPPAKVVLRRREEHLPRGEEPNGSSMKWPPGQDSFFPWCSSSTYAPERYVRRPRRRAANCLNRVFAFDDA
jgi:hypothetical protein